MLTVAAVQVLEDVPFGVLKPILESLLADKQQDKQRAAAELLAGVIGGRPFYLSIVSRIEVFTGSKHWPLNKQKALWAWLSPFIVKIIANLKTDTLVTWTSFLEVSACRPLFCSFY